MHLSSIRFNHSSTLQGKVLACICVLTLATHVPTHTISYTTVAKSICACILGYAVVAGYTTTIIHDATTVYAPARHLLATLSHDSKLLQRHLKQEILRSHDAMIDTSWHETHYRHFPLVWYKNNLDSYLSSLWVAHFFGIVDRQLLEDLYAIKDGLVTDYDFIKERREYEQRYP